jgi:cobalt-zinc-cadmium efflux system protein
MSENHSVPEKLDRKLKIGLVLNTGFTVIEFIAGILSGSLALISDAGHNLTDSLTLLISFLANRISKRKANVDHTYGYGRATILAALINGLILFLLALYIFYEAYQRLLTPHPVEGGVVVIVAFIGLCVNLSIALLFRSEKKDLNIRSAYINMLFDALASVGALIAGVLILITGMSIFDSIISVVIGIFLIRGSWSVVKDAVHVLLEGVPEGLDMEKVRKAILDTPNVKNADDLHAWAISSHDSALSCHITIEKCTLEESIKVVKDIKDKLREVFHIDHATIETELVDCPS